MRVVRGLSDKFVRTRCFSVSAAETAKVRFPVARRAIPKLERHSIPMQHQYSSLTVFTVPVLADAYSYIVFDHHSKEAALIDPCEPELVIKTCERNKIKVSCVLNTSHLDDHAGGNLALRKAFPSLRVFGFDKRIPGLTHLLRPNELVNVGQQRFRALFAPGITAGSGVFHVLSARRLGFSNSPNRNPHSLLFSGDTLTVGGCGRFGGDEMLTENAVLSMYKNLVLQIGSLPGDTEVYCSHEYTLRNLEFADALAGGTDEGVAEALRKARLTRSAFEPTVPAILEDEFSSNPFMRVHHASVASSVGCGLDRSGADVLQKIRERKNVFDSNNRPTLG